MLTIHDYLPFFLEIYAPPRHLHSFPTRRSSDLARRAARDRCSLRSGRRAAAPRRDARAKERHVPDAAGRWERSEEHTSELQSHSDLVCRLLLEKKKVRRRNRQDDDSDRWTRQGT